MLKLLNGFLPYHFFVFRLAIVIMMLIFKKHFCDMIGKWLLIGHVTN